MSLTTNKSILARLLANENIDVIQDNVETASFDVKSRRLTLPFWKEMGKDVIDMLVGHEVAHALFTPLNGIESYREHIPGIPHDYVNIVEDIRIEKLILRKYPGLLGNFKRGYQYIIDQNIFGTQDREIKKMPFMDRLNLSMKARDLIEVPFTPEEKKYVEMARSVETWNDVLWVCKQLYGFVKAQAEEQKANPEEFARKILVLMDGDGQSGGDQGEKINPEDYDEIIDMRENAKAFEESEGEGEGEEGTASGEKGEEDKKTVSQPGQGAGGEQVESINPDQVSTQRAYDQKQGSMSEASDGKIFGQPISKELAKAAYTPVVDVIANRRERSKRYNALHPFVYPEAEYIDFQRELKLQVTAMVKEFEMRKAAYRSARARTSTKGSLDVNKLHTYKYNDHLFKQMTTLADAKNHGMMMLIDYSGSMYKSLPSVIRQLMVLVSFCKRVGIPFQVFGFTSGGYRDAYVRKHMDTTRAFIDMTGTNIFELFNSKMTKVQYDEAMKMIFAQTTGQAHNDRLASQFECLGGTPLNQALIVMDKLIDVFRSTYNVDKMNFVTLTDGDGENLCLSSGYARNQYVEVAGKMIQLNNSNAVTTQIIKAFGEKGIKTLNYFVADSYSLNGEMYRTYGYLERDVFTKTKRQLNKEGMLVVDNSLGYARRFIMTASKDDLDVDELEIKENASTAQIAKQFSKHVGDKKKLRKIAQKFAEIVS